MSRKNHAYAVQLLPRAEVWYVDAGHTVSDVLLLPTLLLQRQHLTCLLNHGMQHRRDGTVNYCKQKYTPQSLCSSMHWHCSTAVKLPPGSQITAEEKGVTEDSKKKCCQVFMVQTSPFFHLQTPTVLLRMKGTGKKMRLWVDNSHRKGWKSLMQLILGSDKT